MINKLKNIKYPTFFRIVQIATVGVFLGRAYQHLFWDAPFRTLLWDQEWMEGIVKGVLGMQWDDYITNISIDESIQRGIQFLGGFYLLAALAAIFIRKGWIILKWIIGIGALSLILLAALYCKEKFFSAGQFFEYTLQFLTPLFLIYLSNKEKWSNSFTLIIKVAIAFTFICHGLYAVNYYPLPGNFVEMTINILGVGEESARNFLFAAGILDFICGVLIFFPRKISLIAIAYMIFWGLGTTLARIWANFYWEFPWASLHQWWFESLYRIPHFLIPLFLFIYLYKSKPSIP